MAKNRATFLQAYSHTRAGRVGANIAVGDLGMDTAKVLVVEDVPELSRLLEMTFELDGRFVPVGTATSGGAALDMAAAHQPDAVVLDLSIDGIDGMGVLPSLRAVLPNARIIVFTGRDDPALRESALAA